MKNCMRLWFFCGCLLAAGLLAGCSSDGHGLGDGGAADLGECRPLQVGDEWLYTLTGFEGDTPLNGVARAIVGTIVLGNGNGQLDDEDDDTRTYWRLETPIYSADEGERWTIFYEQGADGTVELIGIDTYWGLFSEPPTLSPVTGDGGSLTVGNYNELASTASFQFSVPIEDHNNATCNLTLEGTESITIGDEVYQCYKYTGTLGVYVVVPNGGGDDGIVLNINAWFSPKISGLARLKVSWTDGIAHEYNYLLNSFSIAP